MFQTGISLQQLRGAERAGSVTWLPLKQVTFKMKGAPIQVMQSSIWHTAHVQDNLHYCHVDTELAFIRTYAICLAKKQHASRMHLLSSPQLKTQQPALKTAQRSSD